MTDETVRLDCDALLFDLDGVLVDSTACVEHTWRAWASRHGLDAATILRVAHGRRASDTLRVIAPHLDASAELAALVGHEARTIEGLAEVPGARALLDALPRGRWAVVTSGVRAVAEHRLRYFGLPVPAVMVCADEVTHGKPDPEGYLAAAARLGFVPAQCVVVEDAPAGLEAARAANMRVIAVATTYPPEALSGADVVTRALNALTVRVHGGDPACLEVEVRITTTQS
jgi:sugar-phosphatase